MFFIAGAMIFASRRSVGSGVAKFNQEIQGVLAGKYTNPGIAAPDMRQEAKMLFNQADELLQQGMQSEDNLALIEAVDSYRRGLALLPRQKSPLQWDLVPHQSCRGARNARRAGGRDSAVRGGRRSISRSFERTDPRACSSRLGRNPDESRECAREARRAGKRNRAARRGGCRLSRGRGRIYPRARRSIGPPPR